MNDLESLIFYLCTYTVASILVGIGCRRNNKALITLGILIPILIASYRYYVGTDYLVYVRKFQKLSLLPIGKSLEIGSNQIGFALLTWVLTRLGNLNLYFGVCAFLTIVPVILLYKKEYNKYYCGLFCLLFLLTAFTTSLNIMRQGIALAFTFWSSQYIMKRKFIKFILWILLAMSFHITAFIFIPAYFLYNDKSSFNLKQIIIFLIVLFTVIESATLLENFEDIEIYSQYAAYSQGDSRALNRSFFLSFILLIILLISAKRLRTIDNRVYTLLSFSIIAIIIEISGFDSPFIKRSALYYSIYNLILICMLLKSFETDRMFTIASISVMLYFASIFTISFYVLKQSDIIPYKTKESTSQYYWENNKPTQDPLQIPL